MNILSVDNLSKSLGQRVLFENITFGLLHGQKTALVARNGAGKSTLLRILMGQESPDTGAVALNKGTTVGFLPQVPQLDPNQTVMQALYAASNEKREAVRCYEEALEKAASGEPKDMDALQREATRMDELNAWDYETDVKRIIFQLGIQNLEQPISELSGGQLKRVALAKLLIDAPDLLILDEPTNHLDLDMIEWLEEYLTNPNLSVLLVTHDRYFLDRVCNQILELENQKIYKHAGNYEYYLQRKSEREITEAANVDKARNLLKTELEWLRRMPKARTTKSKARIDNVSVLQQKATARNQHKALNLQMRMSRMGSKILEINNLKKSFGDKKIIEDFSYIFKRGERVGIVGKNGIGKSTFLNMIMGLERPDAGKLDPGDTIVLGYYSQQGLQLKEDMRVIEVMKEIAEVIPVGKKGETISVSQFLLQFQFTPEMQYSFVSKLSGGERRRLFLMTILVKQPNFLILDEPTNDLDLPTLQTLETFLEDYPGCLIIVSHDRYFMDRLVDHLFIFEGEGKIRDFNGRYSEYREEQDELELQQELLKNAPKPVAPIAEAEAPKAKKRSFKEQQEYDQLEKEIAQLEAEKAEIEKQLSLGVGDAKQITAWSQRIPQISKVLDEKTDRWLELA